MGRKLAELLAKCRELGIPMSETAHGATMHQALVSYELERRRLEALRQVAAKLGVTLPEGLTRDQAEQQLGPAVLESLKATKHFVLGRPGEKRFTFSYREYVTTGEWRLLNDHVTLSIQPVSGAPLSEPRYVKALIIYAQTIPELKNAYFQRT